MFEATGTRSGRRFGVVLATVALLAASLVAVVGASPAGAATPTHLSFTGTGASQPGSGTAGVALATLLFKPKVGEFNKIAPTIITFTKTNITTNHFTSLIIP